MFESDDFDQVLSQFEIPEDVPVKDPSVPKIPSRHFKHTDTKTLKSKNTSNDRTAVNPNANSCGSEEQVMSPKHTKRKIINSYFDHKTKRKFPGPAGILNGNLEEPEDNSIAHLELLSQDIDPTQNNLHRHAFDSPLWDRLLSDIKKWNLGNVDSIKGIKDLAANENLKRRKAQTITAFVDAVDRSAIDPLIILRDSSGSIKGTLHRDAWSKFSPYIVSQYCALVLLKPTILTTGSAFKKHYLNITLSNIFAIYSSAILKDEEERNELCEGYDIVYEEDFTVIKANNLESTNIDFSMSENNMLDDLENLFSDDVF